MQLLFVEDGLGAKGYHSARLWEGDCSLLPIQWYSQLRDQDPRTIDGIVLAAGVSPAMYQEAIDKCARYRLPLVLLGPWHENLLRHARSSHQMVTHVPRERALTLTGEQLSEIVSDARLDRHRPRARVIIGSTTLRTVVQAVLEEEGFKAEVHATLAAARGAARARHAADVTVVDVFLPDGNGLTVIPAKASHKDAPVILLSPCKEPWIIEEARRRGVHAVVPTPLDPKVLTTHLASAMRKGRQPTQPHG